MRNKTRVISGDEICKFSALVKSKISEKLGAN
jgi:hypothetical protein